MSCRIARHVLAVSVLASLLSVTACSDVAPPAPQSIEVAVALQIEAQMSSQNRWPIIIFVSLSSCEFCHQLRQQVLQPMTAAGDLQHRAILREVSLDDDFQLKDFVGQRVSGREFSARYKVSVTPTLLFLDANGVEVSKRIVGIRDIDYYEFYLDRAITAATTQIIQG